MLKAKSSCNLASLNLYEFVKNKFTDKAYFDFKEFHEAIGIAGKALDDVIDENIVRIPDTLKEYKENARKWRNEGLGTFGYADALMALGLTYGSKEAKEMTDKIFECMMVSAIFFNELRGENLGNYQMFDKKAFNKSTIMKLHNMKVEFARNCSLLSIAPNGSIATMLGRSGGVEPEFALSYIRRTDNLDDEYKIEAQVVKDYRETTGNQGELPEYFVCSADIEWKDRVETQGVIQKHIDTAISSTVNLPKETTVEEVEQLYLYAWKQGLKGITIFRDGCARAGILTTETKDENEQAELKRGDIVKVDTDLIGKKRKLNTGCGSLHCTAFFDKNTGELRETYLSKGSSGGCQNYMIGLSRMMSLAARGGISVYDIVDQLGSTGVCPSYAVRSAKHKDTSKGSCCPMAVGNALTEMYEEMQNELSTKTDIEIKEIAKIKDDSMTYEECINSMICPECGEELISTGGCIFCKACGFSKCD